MPTPKQVRFHYKKIMFHQEKLRAALNDAHDAGVIEYDSKLYAEQSPCKTNFQTYDRIKLTTESTRAQAIHEEIMGEIK